MEKRRSIVDVAEEILLKNGKPMHYKALTPLMVEKCKLTGKTPHESVRSRLATSPKFKRVAEGIFALSIWDEYPSIRFAKDIAYDILKAENKPISLVTIGQQILKERKFQGSPAMIARQAINKDKRFHFNKSLELVGLGEWKK